MQVRAMLLRMMLKMLVYAELYAALSDGDAVAMHAMLVLHDAVRVLSSVRL